MKLKSCASLGSASLTTTMRPGLLLVNVQVTVSPAETLMFVTGLPSLHVALDECPSGRQGVLRQRVAGADRHDR